MAWAGMRWMVLVGLCWGGTAWAQEDGEGTTELVAPQVDSSEPGLSAPGPSLSTPLPNQGKGAPWVSQFEGRALSVRVIPRSSSDSGEPEYQLMRGGVALDEEGLDALGLLDADPVVTVTFVAPARGRSPYLWLLSLPALVAGPFAGAVLGGLVGVAVPAVIGAAVGAVLGAAGGFTYGGGGVAGIWLGFLLALLYGVLVGLYAVILFGWVGVFTGLAGGLVGLAAGIAGVVAAALWNRGAASGGAAGHPYLQAVQRENTKLLGELGLDASRVDPRYLPGGN